MTRKELTHKLELTILTAEACGCSANETASFILDDLKEVFDKVIEEEVE